MPRHELKAALNRFTQGTPTSFQSSRPLSEVAHHGPVGYPEPSLDWQAEVSSLQEKAKLLSAQEQECELQRAQRDKEFLEHSSTLMSQFESVLKDLRQQGTTNTSRTLAAHHVYINKVVEELIALSNDRCNTLNRLFEMRLEQMQQPDKSQPIHQKMQQLEAKLLQVEEENYALKMRYYKEDLGKGSREQELKKLCVEQARELENLKAVRRKLTSDFSHIGVEVSDTKLAAKSISAESLSAVKVISVLPPATHAGLKGGDVITWVTSSIRVTDVSDFRNAVAPVRYGDQLSFIAQRGTRELQLDVQVGR
eukprot:NODE_2807_length_1086_cov_18.117831_g2677_i0.p1 GENE.NODE_2807_length_1086_cov_18.117831_g2677_i0~~NODE_2807_length_1086_cov_18.117831_g2677_i0.p1  ORF type:complete len:337 (-),score=89.70 NODE_2807_length_1086_cov_18.117831_g2677_i0:76-1002(-)